MEPLAQGMRQTDLFSGTNAGTDGDTLQHNEPSLFLFVCVNYSFIIQDVGKKIAMPDWAEELLNCSILLAESISPIIAEAICCPSRSS